MSRGWAFLHQQDGVVRGFGPLSRKPEPEGRFRLAAIKSERDLELALRVAFYPLMPAWPRMRELGPLIVVKEGALESAYGFFNSLAEVEKAVGPVGERWMAVRLESEAARKELELELEEKERAKNRDPAKLEALGRLARIRALGKVPRSRSA